MISDFEELELFKNLAQEIGGVDVVSMYFQYKKFKFLDNFTKNNKPGKVLDLGSNLGHFSYFLYKKGFDVTGIDIDDRFLDISNKFVKNKKMKIHFIKADGTKLPFQNNSFDYVLCLDVLEHIPKKEKALNEINRVLKNKGFLIAALPNVFSYYFGRKAIFTLLRGRWNEHEGMTEGTVHYRFPYFTWLNHIKKADFKIKSISSDTLIPLEPKFLHYLKKSNSRLFSIIERIEDNIKNKSPFKYLGSSFNLIATKRIQKELKA